MAHTVGVLLLIRWVSRHHLSTMQNLESRPSCTTTWMRELVGFALRCVALSEVMAMLVVRKEENKQQQQQQQQQLFTSFVVVTTPQPIPLSLSLSLSHRLAT
jgi:hypothetical protein